MAECVLGQYRPDRAVLAPRRRSHGRDHLQSPHPAVPADATQVTAPPIDRGGTVEEQTQQADIRAGSHAARGCNQQVTGAAVHHILLSELCMDHRRERYHLHLADVHLQFHALQPRYVSPSTHKFPQTGPPLQDKFR